MDGLTDGWTDGQTDGAGHDNTQQPEWAEDLLLQHKLAPAEPCHTLPNTVIPVRWERFIIKLLTPGNGI